jgi:ribosomal protein S6
MGVICLNNYPENQLESCIRKSDKSPLYGEIWVYKQFLNFNKFNFIDKDEIWYLKHDYNLSYHPSSKNKVEGQIDFLLISKYGILIIEVKGGGLKVNEHDQYISYNSSDEYITQNPFVQAKEYTHSLKQLINENIFVYRVVVFPHEAGFETKGPQLIGYKDILFSKKNFLDLSSDDEKQINSRFFEFLISSAKSSRIKIIKELNPNWDKQKVNNTIFERFPELTSKKINSLKSQLFPSQTSYGFNPERINSEIIQEENYLTMKGLIRNNKILIEGGPGTGKTVISKKYLAEYILKHQTGIYYCANKLIKSRLEHSINRDYNISENLIKFKVFNENTFENSLSSNYDFFIFDEAQEYFKKGLFEKIERIELELENPRILILYDPKQTIHINFDDVSFYTDFYIENGFSHYLFDQNYRSSQNKSITKLSNDILHNKRIDDYTVAENLKEKIISIKEIISVNIFSNSEKSILIHSSLYSDFKKIADDFFSNELEELSENNINLPTAKTRYSSPIKFRGLENNSIYLITNCLEEKSKVENYIGVTRSTDQVKIILWTR